MGLLATLLTSMKASVQASSFLEGLQRNKADVNHRVRVMLLNVDISMVCYTKFSIPRCLVLADDM